jgi:hypothetical protein
MKEVSFMKNINQKFLIKIGGICLFSTLILNCGYTFAPQGEYIDKRITTVYVQPFVNKTSQAELENYVRTAFIDQFILSVRFKIVQNVESADAIITGSVVNLKTTPLSYRSNTLVAEERAIMILAINFYEKESGKTIWSTKKITGQVDYKMENNINIFPATRKNAYTKLANDTAEKAFNMMMSGF